jgi:hypothetical protein
MDAVGSRGTACLSLAFADEAEGRWATEGECDVAVYMRDQLHVIECKTGKYQRRTDHVKGVDRDTVKGAKDLKEKLVGPFGTCAIWNLRPVLPEHAGFVAQVAGEASKGRIPLWTGPDGRASAQALWARLVAETEPPSQD